MPQELFSEDLLAYINEWKSKPGNLIMVLHKVQSELGYISREAADEVSRLLDGALSRSTTSSSLTSLASTISRSVWVLHVTSRAVR